MWHVLGRLVKPLLDAVVALPTDDPPLALAAAAVLYFLALDVRSARSFLLEYNTK